VCTTLEFLSLSALFLSIIFHPLLISPSILCKYYLITITERDAGVWKSSSSSVALQSNADLRLLNGPLPVHSYSIRLFRGHVLGFLTVSFLQWQVVSLSPNPQPGGPVHRIYNPRGMVAQLYPQTLGTHFGRLLRPAWAAVGLFFTPVTTRVWYLRIGCWNRK
jgi:hypothetical protein